MSQAAVAGSSTSDFRMAQIMVPLIAIIAGVFMVVLDNTVINVALPKLVVDFNTQLPTLQWTVTGYMLAQATVIPLSGWLSDRFGAKTIFLTSTVLFTIGSVLCSTPHSASLLIFFRVLQGLGGGSVLPVAMAYVYKLSPSHKVGAVMGLMGVPILFAPAIGPVLGGWLVQYHSWRWIFLLNLPVGILSLLVGLRYLPQTEKHSVGNFDLWGIIFGPLAFAALSYGVSEGASGWTTMKTLTGLIVGGVALILFIIVELRAKEPLLELRVFQSVDFTLAILVQWVGQFALFGALFMVPQFLQQARGYGAFETGLILLPQALASGVVMPIGGILFDKIGARWLVVIGLGLVAGAIDMLSHVGVQTTGRDLVLPLIMSGAGMGFMMMPLSTHLMNKAPRKLVSRVTSLSNALQQVISSLSVATLVTILTSRVKVNLGNVRTEFASKGVHLPANIGLTSTTTTAASSAHAMSPAQVHLMGMVKDALVVAGCKAFDETFATMVFVAVAGAILGFVLRRSSKLAGSNTGEDGDEPVHVGFVHGG